MQRIMYGGRYNDLPSTGGGVLHNEIFWYNKTWSSGCMGPPPPPPKKKLGLQFLALLT